MIRVQIYLDVLSDAKNKRKPEFNSGSLINYQMQEIPGLAGNDKLIITLLSFF